MVWRVTPRKGGMVGGIVMKWSLNHLAREFAQRLGNDPGLEQPDSKMDQCLNHWAREWFRGELLDKEMVQVRNCQAREQS